MSVKIEKWLFGACLGLLLYIPFHALLSTWATSHFGHENVIEAAKDGVVALVGLCCAALAIKKRMELTRREKLLAFSIGVFTLLHILWLPFAHGVDQTLAGLIINLRFFIFSSSLFFLSKQLKNQKLVGQAFKIAAIGAVVVCVFGFLQATVLPKDILGHFGYSEATIEPYQTVDNDESTVRILSTLRGPNPLGTYLIVAGAVFYVVLSARKKVSWLLDGTVLVAFGVTLFATYSRAAWLGIVAMVGIYAFLRFEKYQKRILTIGGALAFVVVAVIVMFQESTWVQKTVFHIDPAESNSIDSDDERLNSLQSAAKSVMEKPLGHGIGSAGVASAQGDKPRTIENYFLDTAYQVGIVGLIAVAIIHWQVFRMLWQRRVEGPALPLLASFMALIGINMLWPAWSDETVAYTWWGLAGVFLGSTVIGSEKDRSKNRKTSGRERTKTSTADKKAV